MNLEAMLSAGRAAGGKSKTEGLICTDPEILTIGAEYITAKGQEDAATARKKLAEAVLKPKLMRFWLAGNVGRATPETSVRVVVPVGTPPVPAKLTASFAAQWYPTAGVNLAAIGVPADLVRRKLTLTIDGDEIPEAKIEGVVQAIMTALTSAGCASALSYKLIDYPKAEFATARHGRLTPEQNEALEVAGLNTRCSIKA